MAQRVQQSRNREGSPGPSAGDGETAPAEEAPEPPAGPGIKHCWVSDEHGRLPALLLEWRRAEAGYRGRVVRPVLDEGLGWIVVEEWLPADLLGPA